MTEAERAQVRLSMLGFVFQFHFLLPEFSALENVMLPMKALGELPPEAMRERASALLASLGLAEHASKRPDQLSGGQRQRVAVARALANDPPVILADEPTGSLNSKSSEQVFEILRDLVEQRGKTVVAVTHDLDLGPPHGSQDRAAGRQHRLRRVGSAVDSACRIGRCATCRSRVVAAAQTASRLPRSRHSLSVRCFAPGASCQWRGALSGQGETAC